MTIASGLFWINFLPKMYELVMGKNAPPPSPLKMLSF